MNDNLKILHIEDNSFDAELIRETILSEWKECEIKVVTSKESLKKEIESVIYDLILCDYRIPGFNTGFEALEIIKVEQPDIPVLFISGTIGEELAVELLKKGATDYILKDKLVKLLPSIKRALEEYNTKLEKTAAQKALEESEERFKNLFLNSPVGIYRSTPDGEILLANPSMLNILKFPSFEELKKKNLEKGDFLQESDRKRYNEMMKKNNEVIGFESVWRDSKGTAVYIMENSKAVKDKNGVLLYYEGTIEDVSEKKAAYDALSQSEAQLSLAQEAASMGNWEMDIFWETFTWSKGMNKIYGLNRHPDEINKDILYEFIHPDDKDDVINKIEKEIKESKDGLSYYYRIIRQDGSLRKLYCILRTELLSGSIRKISGTVQDVTEQKRIEEELTEAKKKAEESDRLKTEFLSQISHEIRTPLNTLFNLSHLVNVEIKKEGYEDLQTLFDHIDITGRRLLRTVELILNMATINTNSYKTTLKEIDLQSFINDILKKYNTEINKKGLKTITIYNKKDKNYKSDDYLLHQILDNVINNAVKFTKEGGIEIKISEEEDNLIIDIKDTGIGIADKYFPNLFQPFSQESAGYTRKYEGNGLGLTLTKKFVELLNGTISVYSKKGEGTAFTITLPPLK